MQQDSGVNLRSLCVLRSMISLVKNALGREKFAGEAMALIAKSRFFAFLCGGVKKNVLRSYVVLQHYNNFILIKIM